MDLGCYEYWCSHGATVYDVCLSPLSRNKIKLSELCKNHTLRFDLFDSSVGFGSKRGPRGHSLVPSRAFVMYLSTHATSRSSADP